MTALDRSEGEPGGRDGYWPSDWPAECGGNRRQKASRGRLDAAEGRASVVSRRNDRWNVMFVEREPDQWYLGRTMPYFTSPEPYGWVEHLADHCWIMDCGDIESVRAIHGREPNGRFASPPGGRLSWRRPAPWSGAQRLLRLSLPMH